MDLVITCMRPGDELFVTILNSPFIFLCSCPHRSIYDVLTYVFFFFNVIFGVVMCFLRVFGVFMFTMVMLFRLDWDVYMRGLEGWDTGEYLCSCTRTCMAYPMCC